MEQLGGLGSSGKHSANIFRAMRNLLGIPQGAPEIRFIEIPTVNGERTPHPVLVPHEFFSAFYSGRSTADWQKHIAGSAGACTQFWKAISHTPFMEHHPNLSPNTWRNTVPLGMHVDAGAFNKQDSVYVFSFNSLLGRGTTQRKRFIFTVIKKSLMLDNTMDALLEFFSWSCNVLLSGETPHHGHTGQALQSGGQALAGGWRAALCQIRGDWAFYKECFRFPQWNGAEQMCFCCRASSVIPGLVWTDFSQDVHELFGDSCELVGPPIS